MHRPLAALGRRGSLYYQFHSVHGKGAGADKQEKESDGEGRAHRSGRTVCVQTNDYDAAVSFLLLAQQSEISADRNFLDGPALTAHKQMDECEDDKNNAHILTSTSCMWPMTIFVLSSS